jgi:NAD(P)-dependent dehydrogenase (short-subunit alcohol dehydrogenase family)
VTGASTGIGEALVAPLVRRGARVAISARRLDLLDAIASRHNGAGGSAVMAVPADVTDRDAVQASARHIEQAWGGIDVAIFNAGGSTGDRPIFHGDDYADDDPELFQRNSLPRRALLDGEGDADPAVRVVRADHQAGHSPLTGYRHENAKAFLRFVLS